MNESIAIGGGDDWMNLTTYETDHEPRGPDLGNVSLCKECREGIVLYDGKWHHAREEH